MRVARAFGQSPQAVARAPFAETAWALLNLLDVEAMETLARDGEQLRGAHRTAKAFHDPKLLQQDHSDLRSQARALFTGGASDVAEARARGAALAARIRQGGVLAEVIS